MFRKLALFAMLVSVAPGLARAACSRANLTRCLDSACAINVSTNPAARCQYCGTTNAGTPPTDGMRSVSAGTSTKYNISAKDLKSAPSDPGQRYVWATKKCIALVADCTPDDVSETYDSLIEQSCTAAGISTQMANLHAKSAKTKTQSTCNSEISACMVADNRCSTNLGACGDDADFNKFFAECSVIATGCDDYHSGIRTKLIETRDSAIKSAELIINGIVKSHADERANRIASTRATCTNNAGRESCIENICSTRMANHCDAEHNDERSMATSLCKFYDTACATLK